MNDLRTGFIVEGVLCINVPVKSVLLADIQRESWSVHQHNLCLLKVTWPTHFFPSPLLPPQDCNSLLLTVPTLHSPSILPRPALVCSDKPISPLLLVPSALGPSPILTVDYKVLPLPNSSTPSLSAA